MFLTEVKPRQEKMESQGGAGAFGNSRGEIGGTRWHTKGMRYNTHGSMHCRTNEPSTGRLAEKAKSEGRRELVHLDEGQFPRCAVPLVRAKKHRFNFA